MILNKEYTSALPVPPLETKIFINILPPVIQSITTVTRNSDFKSIISS